MVTILPQMRFRCVTDTAGGSARQDRLRRVVARDPADPTAAAGPGPREEHLAVCRLHAPGADLTVGLGPRPLQGAVEDVAGGQAQVGLEVERGPRLQARVALPVAEQDVLD